ncbi:iron-containing alcohol dehydrogenase [Acinetobacter chinensis]|jgi:alcohol dehydrogenase|uniref:Iron-containing alcohol dehydrogenase n=1 Tax=Acinetobacter chinensis TaxID=2004650 RepID=A0A3B7LVX5_9GAMM|nr:MULTISPECIES: iron-containing alcohol dehydrogenase [Acinetobacter]AXY56956.1 iron-containing alcohol dehydrogenase [Acinetobacter chinensis]AXY60348.1 iron-containing alcohol dehydrogenase [Acinetobacter sp. WCHAc010052]MDV2468966.1 iron-containing alcohol dehydrogenase [Acinetobacter chinensis]WOE40240.1 iron-containing alcohol dehydrogenase [Acinetobacter chinensis]
MAFKNIADQTNGFYIPCVSLFGPGCAKEVGAKAQNLGAKKALIVTDAGLFKFGVADIIVEYLKEAGVDSHVFPGAEPNPTDINVHNGVNAYNENGCDFIVSLGGGSSHDCAKGIGLVTAGGGHIRDYEGIDQSKVPMTPLVAINTTAGTASEMTRFCIITNTDTHVKMAIVDWRCTPLVAIDDPKLMIAKPAALTAATGMDALTHAVEAYVSTAANPITDACAEKAIAMIAEWLRPAVANGENLEARDAMAYAQYLAGMAFNNASLGYVHAMAHQLGGFYNLPHGVCNAILLPHVCEFNLIACPDRFAKIAQLLGVDTTGLTVSEAGFAAIDAIRELSGAIGIPSGLAELGVKAEDHAVMTSNAQKDACMLTNPRKANDAQVIAIFEAAM